MIIIIINFHLVELQLKIQNTIKTLESNNYNTTYKTKHTKYRKIMNKKLDLLLRFYHNIDT